MHIHIRQNSTFTWHASNKFQAIYFLRHTRKTPANFNFRPKSTETFYRKDTSFPFRQNSTPLSVERLSSFQQCKKRFLPTILHPSHFLDLIGFHLLLSSWIVPACTVYSTSFDIIRRFEQGFISSSPLYFAKISAWQTAFLKNVALDFEFPVQSAQTAFSNKNFVKLLPW